MSRVFKKSIVRYLDGDGKQVPKDTPGAKKVKEKSAKWYGRVPGNPRAVPLCVNKSAAQIMLNDLVKKAELAKIGIVDPHAKHTSRPLAEHLIDFEASLLAKGDTPKQARQVVSRAAKVLSGCEFVFTKDLSASRVQKYLASQREDGQQLPPLPEDKNQWTKAEAAEAVGVPPDTFSDLVRRHVLPATGQGRARRYPRETIEALREHRSRGHSVQTMNFYLQAVKQFCRWMVKDRRMGDNPLAHLPGGNVRTDRRHDRRELEEEELRSLLSATRDSQRVFRGLTGWDRYHLYATACATGFRASALASLTPESFDLESGFPVVVLPARFAKNRRQKVQPLPPDVADLLRVYLDGKPANIPLWGGTWASGCKGAEMLRGDLQAAGIPYVVEGPDGPLYADFHALRHTYLTLGGRAGIDLRTLQELAGHQTSHLTERYSHRRLYDLAGAVERLPNFLPTEGAATDRASVLKNDAQTAAGEPPILRATGTDA